MKTKLHFNSSKSLLAVALLSTAISAYAGQEVAASKDSKDQIVTDSNPFCFGPFCLDLEERLRVEAQQNLYTFNNLVHSPTNGTWLQQRFRLGVAWQPVSWFKAYVQGQSSLEAFAQRNTVPGLSGAEGNDPYNLHQAYLEIGDPKEFPLVLKVGRQELVYGDQRLIGNFDWNNFGRTFDAVKLSLVQPHWQLDLFASSVVVVQRDRFDKSDLFDGNNNDRDQIFSGLYFTAKDLSFGTVDLYSLWLSESSGTVSNQQSSVATTRPLTGATSKESSFGTFGGRVFGDPAKLNGWEFNVEGAYQAGTVRGLDLSAFAVHAGAGYNFKLPWNPRLFVEYNYASGDSNPKDGGDQTFQNLFPTNHGLYGIMDNFSWQNLSSPAISLTVTPIKNVTFKALFYGFWLANTNDSWYRANGLTTERPLNAAAEKASSFCGTELDLIANWKVNQHLSFEAGYSHFFAGTYLENTGIADDANFGYGMVKIKF
jgi:hypothetical protein